MRRDRNYHDAIVISWERVSPGMVCVKKHRKIQILWLVMRVSMMAGVRRDALSRSLGAFPGKILKSHLLEKKPEEAVTNSLKSWGEPQDDVIIQE